MEFERLGKVCAVLAMTCSPAPAFSQDALDISGRWRETRMRGEDNFKIGVFEFAPCGENMCGVRVDAKGKCGATFIEAHRSEARTYTGHVYPHYAGGAKWRGRNLDFYVWRHSDGLRMTATEGRSPFSRVLPLDMIENDFQRMGDALCKPSVS